MIETILIICALTLYAPYYDCDEKWTIYKHDTIFVEYKDQWVSAYVDIEEKEIHTGTLKKDRCGMPILWHEFLHIMHNDGSHDWYKDYEKCRTFNFV